MTVEVEASAARHRVNTQGTSAAMGDGAAPGRAREASAAGRRGGSSPDAAAGRGGADGVCPDATDQAIPRAFLCPARGWPAPMRCHPCEPERPHAPERVRPRR